MSKEKGEKKQAPQCDKYVLSKSKKLELKILSDPALFDATVAVSFDVAGIDCDAFDVVSSGYIDGVKLQNELAKAAGIDLALVCYGLRHRLDDMLLSVPMVAKRFGSHCVCLSLSGNTVTLSCQSPLRLGKLLKLAHAMVKYLQVSKVASTVRSVLLAAEQKYKAGHFAVAANKIGKAIANHVCVSIVGNFTVSPLFKKGAEKEKVDKVTATIKEIYTKIADAQSHENISGEEKRVEAPFSRVEDGKFCSRINVKSWVVAPLMYYLCDKLNGVGVRFNKEHVEVAMTPDVWAKHKERLQDKETIGKFVDMHYMRVTDFPSMLVAEGLRIGSLSAADVKFADKKITESDIVREILAHI